MSKKDSLTNLNKASRIETKPETTHSSMSLNKKTKKMREEDEIKDVDTSLANL